MFRDAQILNKQNHKEYLVYLIVMKITPLRNSFFCKKTLFFKTDQLNAIKQTDYTRLLPLADSKYLQLAFD